MIYIFFSIVIKLYLFLNNMQKSYYEYKSLFLYVLKKYYVLFISNIAIGLFLYFKNIYFDLVVISTLSIQLVYLFKKSKVFLKFTKRIVRLLFTIVIEIFIISFFIPSFIIDLLVPLIIVLADLINKPIEKIIKNKYIRNAGKKLSLLSAVKIAITGSYGKTSVKNYIKNVLMKKYIVKASPHSYNTPLGIAKFINNEELAFTDFIVYEFGARRSGDIKELANYYKYDIAIVTEIGSMHIDTFKTQEAIINEKMSLVDRDKIAILNYENKYIRNYDIDCKKYTYGFNYGDFLAKNIVVSIFNCKFDLYIYDVFIKTFCIKPLGKSAIMNILPAIIICYLYNIDYQVIEEVESVSNRLSLRVFEDYYILDDAYNSNIYGACYALEVLKSHNGKKYIITPGFVEMDLIKEELSKEYGKSISDSVDCVILVRNDFTKLLVKYINNKEVIFVDSFKDGFNLFLRIKEKDSILLIENDLLD